ncbi:MAG: hypothetical protein GF383_15220 [Candidatus Lokiarchaeota archaeon]|nr:hypothetical protein [Candidatus Lokiarchaeota archaeon]MBD3342874.1 hypothetical protein [Candidatus Lokiarchaeota archaeon]
MKETNPFKKYFQYLKCLKPLLLSHHPVCDKFSNHVITIGKKKLCIGCFIGYPSTIIGIIILYFSDLINILDRTLFLSIGTLLLSTFILSLLNLAEIKIVKIIQKICLGLGAAFLFWWIWTLSNFFFLNLIYFLLIFGFLSALLNAYHTYGWYRICRKCEHSLNWRECPSGFQKIMQCFEEHGLDNILPLRKENSQKT